MSGSGKAAACPSSFLHCLETKSDAEFPSRGRGTPSRAPTPAITPENDADGSLIYTDILSMCSFNLNPLTFYAPFEAKAHFKHRHVCLITSRHILGTKSVTKSNLFQTNLKLQFFLPSSFFQSSFFPPVFFCLSLRQLKLSHIFHYTLLRESRLVYFPSPTRAFFPPSWLCP